MIPKPISPLTFFQLSQKSLPGRQGCAFQGVHQLWEMDWETQASELFWELVQTTWRLHGEPLISLLWTFSSVDVQYSLKYRMLTNINLTFVFLWNSNCTLFVVEYIAYFEFSYFLKVGNWDFLYIFSIVFFKATWKILGQFLKLVYMANNNNYYYFV